MRYVRATLALAASKHPGSLSDFVSTRLLPVRINPLIHHSVRYPENEVFLFNNAIFSLRVLLVLSKPWSYGITL